MQALNYTPKAIADLRSHPCPGAPLTHAAMRWVADKLERAEVFQLPDCGELLDRSKPLPEVPGVMFRPPYPVIACEYPAQKPSRADPIYTAAPCSRRIALAWEWDGDLPGPLARIPELRHLKPGVVILSVFYSDQSKVWVTTAGATHLAYDDGWVDRRDMPRSPFVEAALARGDMNKATVNAKGFLTSFIPLMIEQLYAMRSTGLSQDAVTDLVRADLNDEVNSYTNLCIALACRNVSAERHLAPKTLNIARKRSGKLLLKDFHVLNLAGGDGATEPLGSAGDRAGPRSHLRRGHIRRLGEGRVTWVNQTMVHGRGGFVDKVYSVGGQR